MPDRLQTERLTFCCWRGKSTIECLETCSTLPYQYQQDRHVGLRKGLVNLHAIKEGRVQFLHSNSAFSE